VKATGQNLNLKGSGMFLSGCSFGGRTPLGSNPRSQSFFFAASLHFVIKVRKFVFFFAGLFSFITWLIASEQMLQQLPFISSS
jgi:hypothetical protein